MSRLVGSLVVLVMLAGSAIAQPGGYPPPQPYAPAPGPYAPQPYAPPAYGYQPPRVQITAEEAEILQRGPISDGAHIGGGLVALFFGFGVGQAVQGRWGDTGWIFTAGEVGSGALMIYGMTQLFANCFEYDVEGNCDSNRGMTPLIVGALALTGFRIWEVVDAFAGPASYNRRYKDIQFRVNGYAPQWGLYLSPSMDRRASVAGLSLSF
jgi:hypothetical protein